MIRGSMDLVHERGSMDPVHILMDPVHILMDPVHGPGPWTRSTEGVQGPGVHVLYFPVSDRIKALQFLGKYFEEIQITEVL